MTDLIEHFAAVEQHRLFRYMLPRVGIAFGVGFSAGFVAAWWMCV